MDSEEEEGRGGREDTIIHCDNDTITICDTRVRLRLCPALPANTRRPRDTAESQFIPVKRKDLFKLLGLNESSDILDPSEEADAKKVALQNFLSSAVDKELFNILLYNPEKAASQTVSSPVAAPSYLQGIIEHFSQNDKTSKKNGILLAPKQGKKNLAKFLGIDMSALAEAEHSAGLTGKR